MSKPKYLTQTWNKEIWNYFTLLTRSSSRSGMKMMWTAEIQIQFKWRYDRRSGNCNCLLTRKICHKFLLVRDLVSNPDRTDCAICKAKLSGIRTMAWENGIQIPLTFFVFAWHRKTDLNFVFSFSPNFENRSFFLFTSLWKMDMNFVFPFRITLKSGFEFRFSFFVFVRFFLSTPSSPRQFYPILTPSLSNIQKRPCTEVVY